MTVPAIATSTSLPSLIDRAVKALANARTSAEILEARDIASVVYDIAKRAARLGKAKKAHDDLIATAYRTQANALEIEAEAKRRLADEYDAAQERGEIAKAGNPNFSDAEKLASGPDILPPKELHEARIIRDAERASPGIVHRTVKEAVDRGEEPTKAMVRRAVLEVARPAVDLECAVDPRETRRARFMNILLEAERLAEEEPDLSALAHFGELAEVAERVVSVWSKIHTNLRELATHEAAAN